MYFNLKGIFKISIYLPSDYPQKFIKRGGIISMSIYTEKRRFLLSRNNRAWAFPVPGQWYVVQPLCLNHVDKESDFTRSRMSEIMINLITGRTIEQGASMEAGKEKDRYMHACGIIQIDPSDFPRLGIMRNTNVKVTSKHGDVVVKAIETPEGPHPGVAYMPMGPWSNSVVDPETYSTGMPTFKGVPITIVSATNEKILNSIELVRSKCWGDR